MHLAELCVDLLHQNEEHHAEVNKSFSKAGSLYCRTVFGRLSFIIGSLSNDNGNVNENGKKKKGNRFRLPKQQLCSCVTLFVHFFAVPARLRRRENAHANSFFVESVKK